MKLALKDVEKRVVIRLDKNIKSDTGQGVMSFGSLNDYPQTIERLVNGSITAKAVRSIYSKFLSGQGFNNDAINSIVVGKDSKGKKITLLSLLRSACESASLNNGFYIHANVNMEAVVGNTRPVPFKNCRFENLDDNGYTAKVGVHDNWEKDPDNKKPNGQNFNKDDVKYYYLFNLNKQVIAEQMTKAGSPEKYKGQIFFHFLDDQYLYPLSPFDSVSLDCDTEYQVSVFKNNMTRNGMTKKSIVRMIEPSTEEEEEKLNREIRKWQGSDGDSVLCLFDELDPETGEIKANGAFRVDALESSIDDKLFEGWNKDLANNIRKAVRACPRVLIESEEGQLGTISGEVITQAVNFYNAMTQDDRAGISEAFKEIFSNFDNEILKNNTDWEIKPLNLLNGNTTQL